MAEGWSYSRDVTGWRDERRMGSVLKNGGGKKLLHTAGGNFQMSALSHLAAGGKKKNAFIWREMFWAHQDPFGQQSNFTRECKWGWVGGQRKQCKPLTPECEECLTKGSTLGVNAHRANAVAGRRLCFFSAVGEDTLKKKVFVVCLMNIYLHL